MKTETKETLTVTVENMVSQKQDESIIIAFKKTIQKEDTIQSLWDSVKDCRFDNHVIGRGGSHIWIKNRADMATRIAIIN